MSELKVPAYLKQYADSSAESMVSAMDALPRISLSRSRFTFIQDGEDVAKTADPIRVVILDVTPEGTRLAKTYFKGKYNPGENSPPDCSSADGIRPDSWVADPVNPTCANCPMNVRGSAVSEMSGKPVKACGDSKRIYVTSITPKLKGHFTLKIPVMSLKNFSNFGKELASAQIPPHAVITELNFDDSKEFPMLTFRHIGFLPEKVFLKLHALVEEKKWRPAMPAPAEQPKAIAKPQVEEKPVEGELQKKPQPELTADVDDILEEWD